MQHIHFVALPSTQKHLIDLLRSSPGDYLVSVEKQTQGIGQRDNTWFCFDHTLCFSFNAKPHSTFTMTSLEIGVLLVRYFSEKYGARAQLKWPNDILNEFGEKCSGILINSFGDDTVVIGIGINLFKGTEPASNFDYPTGYILDSAFQYKHDALAKDIVEYIHANRYKDNQSLQNDWMSACAHQNKKLQTADNQEVLFRRVGDHGEAIVELKDGTQSSLVSGPLRIITSQNH